MTWKMQVWATKTDKAAFKKKYQPYIVSVVYDRESETLLVHVWNPRVLRLWNQDDNIFAFGRA